MESSSIGDGRGTGLVPGRWIFRSEAPKLNCVWALLGWQGWFFDVTDCLLNTGQHWI